MPDLNRDWPKFSIIIPSFNQGQYIEQCIRSIVDQNYPNLELIVIDGGSDDETVSILEKYTSAITYWVSERDRGQSHAINKGIVRATGELINWVNSDDWLEDNALFLIASHFMDHPAIDLIYGDCNLVYPGWKTDLYKAVDFDPVDFVSRISIHQPSTFWRRKLFDEVGILDETMHYCMDFDLWARIVFTHKTSRLPKVLANFRRYPESKSSNFNDQTNVYREYRIVVSRILTSISPEADDILDKLGLNYNPDKVRYPEQLAKIDADLFRRMLGRYVMTCAVQEYNLQNRKECNRLLLNSMNKHYFKEALITLVKNNIGYRKVAHPYRKS